MRRFAPINTFQKSVGSLLDLFPPAETIIANTVGSWSKMAFDLQYLQGLVNQLSAQGNPVIQQLDENIIVTQWNNIAAEGE
jgi:hypothetical protein